MNGPDFLTSDEQKALDHLIDLQIDEALEEKYLQDDINVE